MFPFVPLFAQESLPSMEPGAPGVPSWVYFGITMLLVGGFILSVLSLILRNGRREREMEHLERMKALEVGMPLPGDAPFWTPNRVAAGIGVGVPAFAFVIAFLATFMGRGEYDVAIWASTGAVAVAAIICGSVLTIHLPKTETPQPRPMMPYAKAEFDPDSYDTAGRRG